MSKWNYTKAARSKNRRIKHKGQMASLVVRLLKNSIGNNAYYVRKYRAALAYSKRASD